MNPYKIYTLYHGKRDATTADYFLDATANIPVGMGYYLSDAAKLYRNFIEAIPQPRSHSVADQISGYTLIKRLASGEDLIIPGHDPEVMRRLPIHAEGITLLE